MTIFPKELEDLDDRLQDRKPQAVEFYWPKERAVVNVTMTIAAIEGGGLYSFWSDESNTQNRTIRAFRRVGASKAAALLKESKQFKQVIRSGDYDSRSEEFGPERWAHFNRIEDELFDEFPKLPALVLEFAKRKGVTARPFSKIELIYIWIRHPLLSLFDWWLERDDATE